MIVEIYERIAFKIVTRDILQGTNRATSENIADCINYIKRHNLNTNVKAILHLKTI